MIETQKPNIEEIIRAAEYEKRGGQIHCPHDFHNVPMDFGDIVLCNVCHRYYTKVKGIPWVRRARKFETFTAPSETNHCNMTFFIQVEIRITD